MKFPIQPVSDILIVEPTSYERVSPGGLFVTDGQEHPEMGVVVARGPGEVKRMGEDGEPIRDEMFVEVGDRVLFNKNMVQDIRVNGVPYRAVRQRHCHGVL